MMTHPFSSCLGGIRRKLLLFVLAFLSLPYLVDVAFLGDLTPTHYAQENAGTAQEEADLLDGTAPLPHVSEQLQNRTVTITQRYFRKALRYAVPAIVPLEQLFSAYHPFRPPPSV
jgi:hypothetical protein